MKKGTSSSVKEIINALSPLCLLAFMCGCEHPIAFKSAAVPNHFPPAYVSAGYTNEAVFKKEIYSKEWAFNHGDKTAPPKLGLALSGGGFRSANFCLGVLKGLYDTGNLTNVDVISAVSGGSYTLSWLLCQSYYESAILHKDPAAALRQMFQDEGPYLQFIRTNSLQSDSLETIPTDLLFMIPQGKLQSWKYGIYKFYETIFGTGFIDNNDHSPARASYREMIQTTFQTMPPSLNPAKPKGLWEQWFPARQMIDFYGTQSVDYETMATFALKNQLPDFVINSTLYTKAAGTHKAATNLWQKSFEFTPYIFGSDSFGYQNWSDLKSHTNDIDSFSLSPAISGAVYCRKNMQEYREIGSWISWLYADLGYNFYLTNNADPIHLSDGGHCENLGLYALIKRRCSNIIVVDAEWENKSTYDFESYKLLKTNLLQEMNLTLVVDDIDNNHFTPTRPVMLGTVSGFKDPTQSPLKIFYLKLSLDTNNYPRYPASVVLAKTPKRSTHTSLVFPQENTFKVKYSPGLVSALIDLGDYITTNSLATNLDTIPKNGQGAPGPSLTFN